MPPESMTLPLELPDRNPRDVPLDEGAGLLGGFALPVDREVLEAMSRIVRDARSAAW